MNPMEAPDQVRDKTDAYYMHLLFKNIGSPLRLIRPGVWSYVLMLDEMQNAKVESLNIVPMLDELKVKFLYQGLPFSIETLWDRDVWLVADKGTVSAEQFAEVKGLFDRCGIANPFKLAAIRKKFRRDRGV